MNGPRPRSREPRFLQLGCVVPRLGGRRLSSPGFDIRLSRDPPLAIHTTLVAAVGEIALISREGVFRR